MSKFQFLGNGELQRDHSTMTVRSMTALALVSNGPLSFRGPNDEPLQCIEVNKFENAILIRFRITDAPRSIDWGTKPVHPSVANIPVIADIEGSGRDYFPITIERSDDEGRPVVLALPG